MHRVTYFTFNQDRLGLLPYKAPHAPPSPLHWPLGLPSTTRLLSPRNCLTHETRASPSCSQTLWLSSDFLLGELQFNRLFSPKEFGLIFQDNHR